MLIAQTLAEYGFLASLVAGVAATRDRIELYVGSGNLKYLILAACALIVLMLARTRRGGR